MSINSLNALLQNPTFKILAQAQTIQDDKDPALQASKMTRSPYQLLALLLLWGITQEASKAVIIKKINDTCPQITADKLDTLAQALDWKALFEELNSSPNSFLKLEFPKHIKEHLEKYPPIPKELLANVITEGTSDQFKIITTINQQLKWLYPFDEAYESWVVPERTYEFSTGLKTELANLNNQLAGESKFASVNIGAFSISAEKMKIESYDDYHPKACYTVAIKNGGLSDLKAQLPNKTNINPGLYSSFVGATLQGGFPVVGINVTLDGNAYLNKTGAGVEQRQIVTGDGCMGMSPRQKKIHEYIDFNVTVNNVYALFDSLIAVNFSQNKEDKNASDKSSSKDIFIKLKGYVAINNKKLGFSTERHIYKITESGRRDIDWEQEDKRDEALRAEKRANRDLLNKALEDPTLQRHVEIHPHALTHLDVLQTRVLLAECKEPNPATVVASVTTTSQSAATKALNPHMLLAPARQKPKATPTGLPKITSCCSLM